MMEFQERKNGKRLVFSEASYLKVAKILVDLLKRSQARLSIFADKNGYPIVHRGDISNINLSSLTALAAGDFAATAEMAKMISAAPRFKYLYHEGTSRSMYTCSVGDDYFLLVIFDTNVALGVIRMLTHHAVEKIARLISELKQEGEQAKQFLDIEFRDLLRQRLDKTLNVR